jgi:predicted amidohydrolase
MNTKVKVALVQAAPVHNNLQASLQKALNLIDQAAAKGAHLTAFAEGWLSGYPAWIDYCPDIAKWGDEATEAVFVDFWKNSLIVGSPETDTLAAKAKEHKMTIIMGANERTPLGPGPGTLFNTLLTFGPEGNLLNHHRKLMPTFNEKLFHTQGDARGLKVVSGGDFRVSGLICFEHFMPLSRMALHQQAEDVHVAAWPNVLDRHLLASRHYAFEGRCFVLAVGQLMRIGDIPAGLRLPEELADKPKDELLLKGGSCLISPQGELVIEQQFGEEGIYTAEIDLDEVIKGRLTLDAGGHYNRPDVFDFRVK